jgi:DNA adenine methylase
VSYQRWVEPFVGSASLFLDQRPAQALLADANTELIQTYVSLRDAPTAVLEALRAIPVSRHEYDRQRLEVDPLDLNAAELAARFIYTQSLAFNGLVRAGSDGRSTAAYSGQDRWKPATRNLLAVSERLQGVELLAGDFEATLARTKPGDLAVCDPPYYRTHSGYLADGFTLDDHARLAAALRACDARGVKFLITLSDAPETGQLYDGFKVHRMPVRRNVAAHGADRTLATELCVLNYEPDSVAAKTSSFSTVAGTVAAKEPQHSGARKTGRASAAEVEQQVSFVRELFESGLVRRDIVPAFRSKFGRSARTCDEAIAKVKNGWTVQAVEQPTGDRTAGRLAFVEKLEGDVTDMKAAGSFAAVASIRRIQAAALGYVAHAPEGPGEQRQPPGATTNIVNLTLNRSAEDIEHETRLLKRVIALREGVAQPDPDLDALEAEGESVS